MLPNLECLYLTFSYMRNHNLIYLSAAAAVTILFQAEGSVLSEINMRLYAQQHRIKCIQTNINCTKHLFACLSIINLFTGISQEHCLLQNRY